MDPEQLHREARALARPCVHLRDAGDVYAAVWGATQPSGFKLAISSTCFPEPGWPERGVLEVASTPSGAVASFERQMALPGEPEGVRLYATPATSLPPVDAIFLLGSEHVREWLRSFGWPPDAGYNDNFPGREIVAAYERAYQSQLPLYSGSAHAQLGGWHLPWPDGDWFELVGCQLLVWTFAGAEPWVEVWAHRGRIWVKERIS